MEAGRTALWKKMAAQTRVVTVGLVRHIQIQEYLKVEAVRLTD